MKEKLQYLLDHEEIRQLAAKYVFAFDTRDEEAYVSCWTEDGFVERRGYQPTWQGHEQLAALVRVFPVEGRHLTTDLLIKVEGDRATMKSYLLYLDMKQPCEVSMVGVYDDILVRTSEGWKFEARSFEYHTIRESETSEEFTSAMQVAAGAHE